MPIVVVTRLRVRDQTLNDAFFVGAVSVLEQSKKSEGFVGSDVLADANDAWWTVSAWTDRTTMRAFVGAEPHLSVMAHLDDWCDEATFVDWEQPGAALPDWQTCHRHLVADGTVATLSHPSDAHASRSFPPPVDATKPLAP